MKELFETRCVSGHDRLCLVNQTPVEPSFKLYSTGLKGPEIYS